MLSRSFSFLRNALDRKPGSNNLPFDDAGLDQMKESIRPIISEEGAIPIDLAKLKLEYLPDTE